MTPQRRAHGRGPDVAGLLRSLGLVTAVLVLYISCGSDPVVIRVQASRQQAQTSAPAAAQRPTGSVEQMVASIALYPDSLLAQMLMSATDPAKVTELHAWLKANAKLRGTELQDAAVKAGFEASFVALALFPKVVEQMATQIAWTTALGQAFTSDRSAVFAAIQKLRKQAHDLGTLKDTPQQAVEVKATSSGENVIVIEPTNPQVVYVPQYNTQVVYTQAPTSTVVVVEDDDADEAIAAGLIGFTAGVAIGATMSNSYYYGPYGWHGGAYMYNDAWDDYYDHREDAREDWMDHREDLSENRNDRLENTSEQRADRRENVSEQRTDRRENTSGQRTERQANRSEARPDSAQRTAQSGAATSSQVAQRSGSTQARGYSESGRAQSAQRSGARSDAFSGYSSGQSQRSASSRGQRSRGSARGGGGGGGGGRRR